MARSITIHALVLSGLFCVVFTLTTYARKGEGSVMAYISRESYGWPYYWLTVTVEYTEVRAFYERKPKPPSEERKRIRQFYVNWQAFGASATSSAVIAGFAWLPFFIWRLKKRARQSETRAAEH